MVTLKDFHDDKDIEETRLIDDSAVRFFSTCKII